MWDQRPAHINALQYYYYSIPLVVLFISLLFYFFFKNSIIKISILFVLVSNGGNLYARGKVHIIYFNASIYSYSILCLKLFFIDASSTWRQYPMSKHFPFIHFETKGHLCRLTKSTISLLAAHAHSFFRLLFCTKFNCSHECEVARLSVCHIILRCR